MAYFERVGASVFRPTRHVGGAWDPEEQHIGPALGLLAHLVEQDRDARRDDGLHIGRLSYDIHGRVPLEDVESGVRVARAGRTVELVEAELAHAGRTVVAVRAWLMRPGDSGAVEGTGLPGIPGPESMKPWDPSTVWPGGFVASAEVRRDRTGPGRAAFWIRTEHQLVAGEPVGPLAGAATLFDLANGMAVRADPQDLAFPNLDLTAHLFRQPRGAWTGFDTTVSFGPTGLGLTSSTLHDQHGPLGTLAQSLTLRTH
ncbi:acyl-CoA thioesterase domain-containing protein [Streptomyces sp. HNM0574]|uniref:acyl-CoA thioesterase domain-containing protein n=1 Tax=Streptomyces sp. HNM0574 TaxID=2714954 RepID=UPI00146BA4A4|nr:thioesterase family protein [Streptomyces sp. HNM0574]